MAVLGRPMMALRRADMMRADTIGAAEIPEIEGDDHAPEDPRSFWSEGTRAPSEADFSDTSEPTSVSPTPIEMDTSPEASSKAPKKAGKVSDDAAASAAKTSSNRRKVLRKNSSGTPPAGPHQQRQYPAGACPSWRAQVSVLQPRGGHSSQKEPAKRRESDTTSSTANQQQTSERETQAARTGAAAKRRAQRKFGIARAGRLATWARLVQPMLEKARMEAEAEAEVAPEAEVRMPSTVSSPAARSQTSGFMDLPELRISSSQVGDSVRAWHLLPRTPSSSGDEPQTLTCVFARVTADGRFEAFEVGSPDACAEDVRASGRKRSSSSPPACRDTSHDLGFFGDYEPTDTSL
eukprot:gnl/TRDRNA2_/TRDRNA2_182078_c0_seq1.p1 gnl/TRDRNA2_/TRDRNA2_182078_c0~~gnl/TRDRNA2_/TRDRNA2_182078_c0_seq1.p1  ORF type:complete len:393 (-),score=62.68 gnl/TRDRNA2_/TRDRNA2_182078_c0_seq1:473-1522(-)